METKQKDNFIYLTAPDIAAPHCFTTRYGGVSTGVCSSMNIGTHRDDVWENVLKNYQIIADVLGFDMKKLVLTHQTHTDIVRVVTQEDWGTGLFAPEFSDCDALVTNTPGTALVVFSADCTPILLWDKVTGAVGAAHAGWRGTAAQIGKKTVQKMVQTFGCDPKNICGAIGPSICTDCFETDYDVPQAMLQSFGEAAREHIYPRDEKCYVNLKTLNALSLQQAGVTRIDISEECTKCNPEKYWSARITGGNRGSQGAIILCQEVGK